MSQVRFSRRTFLATAGAMAAASSTGMSASPQIKVPMVDRLSTQVLVDSSQFGPFLDDIHRPGLAVERNSRKGPPAARMNGKTLEGEFGLSLLNESKLGEQTKRVLIDFGFTSDVMANNIAELGLDPTLIDAAILSHGHIDHYGGYRGLFSGGKPAKPLPLYVGEEEAFCERTGLGGNPPTIMGALDRSGLAEAGLDVLVRPEPSVVAGHAFTTGIIAMSTSERAAIPTQMRPGVGCEAKLLSAGKRDKTLIPDDGEHELATAYLVKGLGLVVISSCGHRGILNTIRQAQLVSGVNQVHAVMGGFHLVKPRTEDEARATAAALKDINPNFIIPMHCTGEVFIAEAIRIMPDKVIRPYVGNRIIFLA